MKFVTVKESFFKLCSDDKELLQKGNQRPHVLLVKLKYKGHNKSFAVPLRSNIPPNVPKSQYFPLPPRKTTKPRHRHGLHYIKMFPVSSQYLDKFLVGKQPEYLLYQGIIDKNIKRIVNECQSYLTQYEKGQRPRYSVDIDKVLEKLTK